MTTNWCVNNFPHRWSAWEDTVQIILSGIARVTTEETPSQKTLDQSTYKNKKCTLRTCGISCVQPSTEIPVRWQNHPTAYKITNVNQQNKKAMFAILINKQLYTENTDDKLQKILLLNYRSLGSSCQLLKLIRMVFTEQQCSRDPQINSIGKRQRICFMLKEWIARYYQTDFCKNETFRKELDRFIKIDLIKYEFHGMSKFLEAMLAKVSTNYMQAHLSLLPLMHRNSTIRNVSKC